MILTKELLKVLAPQVTEDKSFCKEREENRRRYLMFSGSTRQVIEQHVRNEFKKQETINELLGRLVPLNVMQKVINKLAGVYKEAPLRKLQSDDEDEIAMLNKLVDGMDLNMRMKEANRFFKMNKRVLLEPYLDDQGVPSVRVLPAHTYRVFSIQTKKKSVPNVVCKIDEVSEYLIWWSDESHWVTDYKGEVISDRMEKMDNKEGENPYGELQFVYINESSTSVDPIQDDDLLAVSVVIPLLLTDLVYGLKYQCFSIIWTVGKVGNIPFNPNSVIQMEYDDNGKKPEINTIKPNMDSDKLLNSVMALVSILLTTKNLQAGAITDQATPNSAASGIAKVIDSAESTEDKKDQQAYFLKGESTLWKKLSNQMRYWRETKQLNAEYDFEIPEDFAVTTSFQDPQPLTSEAEKIDIAAKKVEKNFSTIKRELKKMNPDMKDEEIDALYKEIIEEKATMAAALEKARGVKNGMESQAQG